MDVWVPMMPAAGKLPSVVAVFGGGYGDKMGGFINDARPLPERGFVVAAPDYALQTDAAVPLCAWDVANAIRCLRARADRYRIDPERIGIWGWSAGGWIAQDLCFAGPERIVHTPAELNNKRVSRWFPMLDPRPQFPEQSVRVQAVVSDWDADEPEALVLERPDEPFDDGDRAVAADGAVPRLDLSVFALLSPAYPMEVLTLPKGAPSAR